MVEELADQIAAAERHVGDAREIVAEQTARIQQLHGIGADICDAERRLRLFESNLTVFEEHFRWLLEQQGNA